MSAGGSNVLLGTLSVISILLNTKHEGDIELNRLVTFGTSLA
jgi:hypothetical protein